MDNGCCDSNCTPVLQVDVEPCREPLDCTPPPKCCTHCLLDQFTVLYPHYVCGDDALYKICLLLHQAETFVAGILDGQQRSMAIMLTVLHLMDIERDGQLVRQSQEQSIAFGEVPTRAEALAGDFWGLTSWGKIVQTLLAANPRVSFMLI
jgi:hypothetical protein